MSKRMLLVFLIAIFAILPLSADAYQPITVLIDGQPLVSDVDPQIVNSRTLVPLRAIFEYFGADVMWDGTTKTVTATTSDKTIKLTIDEVTAYVNNKPSLLDVPATIIDSRTMVPLRFISEALGAHVEWQADTRTVLITTKSTKPSGSYEDISLGMSFDEVASVLGDVDRVVESMFGFQWNMFHNDYADFNMIGIRDNRVVAIYSMAGIQIGDKTIKLGDTRELARDTFGSTIDYIIKGSSKYYYNETDIDIFKLSTSYLRVFYDDYEGTTVTSVYLLDQSEETRLRGYYGTPTETLRDSFEKQLFDLANAERKLSGLTPFEWAPELVPIARAHSQDMIDRAFFDHVNPSGLSPHDRLRLSGLDYQTSSENIACGQISAIFAHEDLMNSIGHRKIILGDSQRFAAGVAFGGTYYQYFTENLYTPN
ncbi:MULTISPECIES: stalk domain-containing protein [unclassified Fusibacter]|uniref:stalk domain-containing protein n=1 Tax=unclassified Fusibacter TaxID=2624464 RepID=UPI0010139724|nr:MULTISPECIES: stalk domain-containing protein [unclassified Fusibacter]MCK8059332.1 stalk domain-containing protein [Fusibacter sp. A2]NPE21204.1 hypothetical protein [Fusibacter sp. A1]RXV62472.1 hypothetical protein DWB64_05160 [Fusibacter sp. A1]